LARTIHPANIIWAVCPDRSGKNAKLRPLIVLEVLQPRLRCLCISTDPQNDPRDPTMEISWSADGSAPTGLLAWCRVVLLWQEWIEPVRVVKITGTESKVYLRDLIEKRQVAIDFPK
jgi:hypothetical protein